MTTPALDRARPHPASVAGSVLRQRLREAVPPLALARATMQDALAGIALAHRDAVPPGRLTLNAANRAARATLDHDDTPQATRDLAYAVLHAHADYMTDRHAPSLALLALVDALNDLAHALLDAPE